MTSRQTRIAALHAAATERILILDACNSGQVVQTLGTGEKSLNSDQRRALELINDRSGMFVLAGRSPCYARSAPPSATTASTTRSISSRRSG
jgi:hypothetical protein